MTDATVRRAGVAGPLDRFGDRPLVLYRALAGRRVTRPAHPRAAALVVVALDLPGDVIREQVDRVRHVARVLPGAERDSLEVEGRLGHLRDRVRGVAFLA